MFRAQLCSKHLEAYNKLIIKKGFCALSWFITGINILRCTVSKTSKIDSLYFFHEGFVIKIFNAFLVTL